MCRDLSKLLGVCSSGCSCSGGKIIDSSDVHQIINYLEQQCKLYLSSPGFEGFPLESVKHRWLAAGVPIPVRNVSGSPALYHLDLLYQLFLMGILHNEQYSKLGMSMLK